ncbi:MAG: type VI secretion system baseplate subunit TssG [Burkholderiales bacterium]|nr:type VI secretion system baseplate subunit TssG [Burkholderiales bacterium]
MFAEKRRFEPSVIQRLLDEPHKFQFFQTVRMLELWLKRHGEVSETAVANYLRFKNRIALSFPASEIEALNASPKGKVKTDTDLLHALENDELEFINITPSFMGFLGSNGALPYHYTERIATHQIYQKDEAPRAFLDTFSNRSLALFYKAWCKYRLELKYELNGLDQFLPLLLSIAGLGNASLQKELSDDAGVLNESLAYYAAAIRHRPVSAMYMQKVLSDYFSVPFVLQQFIGCWYQVPPEQQTRLGGVNVNLGSGALLGQRVWQRDLRVRILIGPLNRAMFEKFLPGRTGTKALQKMLTMFTSVSMEYEVQLILRKEEIFGTQLDATSSNGRLGWDSFLLTQEVEKNRSDVRYEIHALSSH